MSRLVWREEYSVGDAEIDHQHRNLFTLIDRLESTDLDRAGLAVTFDKLEAYVQEHFFDEEEKLRACKYDDLEAHLRQHAEFRDWLYTARESFDGAGEGATLTVGRNIHDFLREWLLRHI